DDLWPETTVLRRNLASQLSQNRRAGPWRLDAAATPPGRSPIRHPPFAQSGHYDFPPGRTVASGHFRSQDGCAVRNSRRVQTDFQRRPWNPNLRASAATRHNDGHTGADLLYGCRRGSPRCHSLSDLPPPVRGTAGRLALSRLSAIAALGPDGPVATALRRASSANVPYGMGGPRRARPSGSGLCAAAAKFRYGKGGLG